MLWVVADLELLAKQTQVYDIWMFNNSFSGTIPAEIRQASALQTLLLNFQTNPNGGGGDGSNSNSSLGGFIPKELGELQNLITFDIRNNNFTGSIPPELGNMSSLQDLYIATNKLTGSLPQELGNLTNLLNLYFYSNQISGPIPTELGNLQNLSQILAYDNNLNGTIPSSFGGLSSIQYLDLHSNSFSGTIPPQLFNCSNLGYLDLSSNKLFGQIPPQIAQIGTSLLTLNLLKNSLSGPLPLEFEKLVALETLQLNDNNFSGMLPSGLGNLVNLDQIYLYDNQFSGPLPTNLGMMSNLSVLDIRKNSFNGTLPTGLCQNQLLNFVDIGWNMFQGSIPMELASCGSLATFSAKFNFFTSIPNSFGKDNSHLTILDVSWNHLQGPLPLELGVNSNLSNLALGNNGLWGDLSPLVFSSLPNLQKLNLSSNRFTGPIPDSLASCKELYLLDLSFNALNGSIPPTLPSTLQTIWLQGNNFSDQNPSVYASFQNLNDLNLAQNAFKGPIPSELGELDVLTTLNLSWNQFSGSIPSSLGSLHTLQVLDLSHNNLSGSIPSTLGQLMSLESANISYNDITGSLPPSWVKLLKSDPNSFVRNPGLCLNYSSDDQCMIVNSSSSKTHLGVILAIVVPSFIVFILVCSILVYFIFKRNSKRTLDGHENIEAMSALNSDISYNDIIDVTHNLSVDFIIGKGAHGTVYKATMPNGNVVAVKKIISIDKDMQIHKSFLREIDTIGKIKHRNLVKFLGFCKWGDIGLLVYDYIPNGDLFKALHNTVKGLDLDWNTRLKIAEGVANGLVYLHHDCIPPIIHRDIKSSNVLLDENLEAHITDFGVAKVMALKPKDDYATSTANIGGTYGYIAPGKDKPTHISFCLNIIVMQTWLLSFFIILDLLMVDV